MSHFHDITYTDLKQLIPYINGLLRTLEILNSEVNHGQTFYVEEIERLETYEESIKKQLQDENYVITFKEKEHWKKELEETFKFYAEAILNRIELTQTHFGYPYRGIKPTREGTNFNWINEEFISLISKIITVNSKFMEVFVDSSKGSFYECHQKDYLVDNEKGLFFIHFAECD